MNFKQAFKIAFKSIAAKKGRSALTMLGVIIGLAAVIILVSYAEGQNAQMKAFYESMGVNIIYIEAGGRYGKDYADDLYTYCMELDEYMVGVSPKIEMTDRPILRYKSKTLNSQELGWEDSPRVVMGNQQFSLCANYTLARGRDISYLDVQKYNQICILGSNVAAQLFNYADPVGRKISINNLPFEVVGVFQEQDPQKMTGNDNIVLVPYTMTRYLNKGGSWSTFVAKARDSASTTKAITLLNGFLKGLVGEDGWYSVNTPDQMREEGDEQIKMQQRFLGGIAAISLAVGGIGIMNIMLVTVTERTREIGIRKAIGAERRSIIVQFLIEACMICGIGGIIGILVGYVGTLVVGKLSLHMILLPGPGITVKAFLISVALGVGFGLYPAIKASGLQPVVALRAE